MKSKIMSFNLMEMSHILFHKIHVALPAFESLIIIMGFLMKLKIYLIRKYLAARARLAVFNLFEVTSELGLLGLRISLF